ncbi:MAG: MFS transporter [Thermoleophilaceae bacterium]|nr:MFS transporter [Thermoleophilaceae bacterium]
MHAAPDTTPVDNNKWWTLTAVSIAIFMLLLDITVVNVALPDIRKDLNASFTDLQWVVDAYSLALATTLLAFGSIADLIGRRLIFIVGLGVFITASLACGLANQPDVLNISRAVQGMGGAMMFSTSLALIASAFQGPERGTAFGVFGAVTGGAVAIGPLIGGVIADGIGWEWIFFVNIPIGLGAIALTLRKVAESRDPHGYGIDWAGVVTFSGSLFLLVLSLIQGNDLGWTSTRIVAQLTGWFVLLVLFLVIEMRKSHPLFDMQLFKKPAFVGASIAAFALSASMFSLFLYITLYIQNVLGFGPLEAGLRFLPITLLSFLVAPIAGKLTQTHQPRWFLGGGLLLIAAGILLMQGIDFDSKWTFLLPGFAIAGIGIGLVNPPLASTAVGVVPPERSGMGSGINSTFRQIGIATGIAGLGAIFQSRVNSTLTTELAGTAGVGNVKEFGRAVTSGAVNDVVQQLPVSAQGAVARAGTDAFISGYHAIFYVATAIALVGAILSVVLVRPQDFVPHGFGPPAEGAED